jgi:trans-2,3-dihydro-3-hydroxyanthranilate isomerase
MTTRQALVVDAFTDEPTSGNPAGVIPDAGDLTDDQMQAIAAELGASETAFVLPSEAAERRLRFFTPETEVDLCGHATVAAHAYLFERATIDDGTHTVETNVGVLEVEADIDGRIWVTQDRPTVTPADVEYETVADALGLDVAALADVGADLPLSVADAGFTWLLVPVNFLEHLGGATPDMFAIQRLCEDAGCQGVYAFTFDSVAREATLHARAFAPLAGVPEDPVTGTAAGAVAVYIRREGAIDAEVAPVVCEQGHYIDRPGTVWVRTDPDLQVGGRAVTTLDGDLVVPEPDADDIIEV